MNPELELKFISLSFTSTSLWVYEIKTYLLKKPVPLFFAQSHTTVVINDHIQSSTNTDVN